MRGWRLLWQLYPSYLLITLITLLTVALYGSGALKDLYNRRTEADLQSRAWLLENDVAEHLASGRMDDVDALCKRLGRRSSTRITVILPDGKVVGDSEGIPAEMDPHGDREEIAAALDGRVASSMRPSPTLKQDMMYVAVPIERDGRVVAVLRTSIPVTTIDDALRAIRVRIAVAGLVVALLAAGISLLISRRISRPLEQLKLGAQRFTEGDLAHRLHVGDTEEIAALAETMNHMAAQLDRRIRAAFRERNQREAMLSSMVEGVVAVDSRRRVIRMNQAAARLFEVDAEAVAGRGFRELVRNNQLLDLLENVLTAGRPLEDDVVLSDGEELFLRVNATVLEEVELQHGEDSGVGALLVLHDVTRLRRLENIRRDFVANVSHELKTPITSVKGFVETLLDGAMHDPADTERFLRIVAAQADRLNEIIEDLLTLSRIERDSERAGIVLQDFRIREVLKAAVEACRPKAAEKKIDIQWTCDTDLAAKVNPPMLEQAVVNLVDNAVKYSPDGETVYVEAEFVQVARGGAELVIRVRDHGCGIAAEHLPRLFERFYRVDKARSRKLGGTGLGLAIVKHIAQAHGGRAMAESTPGEGSTFSLHLPA